jgi:membrane protease YdiL (CAAX protease family)
VSGKIQRQMPHPRLFMIFMLGITAWMLAFPIVQVVGQLLDLVLFLMLGLEGYEQVAVKYLKTAFQSPMQTILALISIVIIAPIVEEFLFRGTLQTYLKRRFQPKTAIVISALCFGLFHFSLDQGIGNVSLIGSLFVFWLLFGIYL